MSLNKLLFTRIDNSALIVFRVFFGFLITCEAWGALATGWVRRILVTPEFTFNFIGFDFLQTFPGPGPQMYAWFGLMGVFGVMVMLGFKYRVAIIGYAIMWSTVYFMQKTAYNNHYYLLMLLLWIMAILPANAAFSIDARFRESVRNISMPRWVTLFIIFQLWIVYTYASIAKIYPDWLDATVPEILMRGKKDYWLVGGVLQKDWTHWIISYVGIAFDGLIIPLLLWKRTRTWAFFISIFFHLFNSFVFQIGIFPYMSLAFTVFFFEPKTIHNLFLKRWKPFYERSKVNPYNQEISTDSISGSPQTLIIPKYKTAMLAVFAVYFIVQIGLPLRQHFIQDNVLWSEEGHRLSWRMMLRSKGGTVTFTVKDKATGKRTTLDHKEYLTKNQQRNIRSKPDVIWQFAQYIKQLKKTEGQDVAVYVKCRIRINGRKSQELIDPGVDLASVDWNWFSHNPWVLDSDGYLDDKVLFPSFKSISEEEDSKKL
jgi:vitamin K-dependent gamma-carboxylase